MKIEISKEELREIVRLCTIGIITEHAMIDEENKRKNDEELRKDEANLLIKLAEKADNSIEMDFIEESMSALLKNDPNTMKILIDSRKRTYTSKYWNYLDGIIPS